MAFPSVRSSNSGTTSGTSHVVPMPGTIVAGDFLIVVGSRNVATGTTTPPGDFSTFGTGVPALAFRKIAAGGDTATVATSATVAFAWVTIAVQDWFGDIVNGFNNVSSADSNPASNTPAWGADDTLWVEALCAQGGTVPSVSAWSTNFTEIVKVTGDFATDTFAGMADRQINTTNQDPGSPTVTGSPATTQTRFFAIRPAAAASTENPYPYIGGGYYPTEG